MGKLSQTEMDAWSNEGDFFFCVCIGYFRNGSLPGDRVQWFRAEAEMQRWQEQKEQKLVELLRTIRSFVKMQLVWSQLGDLHSLNQPGHTAYARQKASMYERRIEDAKKLVRMGGHEDLLTPTANVINFIEAERAKEREYLKEKITQAMESLPL